MPGIQGQGSSKVVACGGGGGTVTGATVGNTVQNVSLVTLPASPTDAEYEVNICGVLKDSALAAGYGVMGFSPKTSGEVAAGVSGRGFDAQIFAGPGSVVAVPVLTSGIGAYQMSYSYIARRVV